MLSDVTRRFTAQSHQSKNFLLAWGNSHMPVRRISTLHALLASLSLSPLCPPKPHQRCDSPKLNTTHLEVTAGPTTASTPSGFESPTTVQPMQSSQTGPSRTRPATSIPSRPSLSRQAPQFACTPALARTQGQISIGTSPGMCGTTPATRLTSANPAPRHMTPANGAVAAAWCLAESGQPD